MSALFHLLTVPDHIITIQLLELRKIALLSTFLPIWQFEHFYSVTRDVEQDYTNAGHSFQNGTSKSGQKSIFIDLELHELWWMDSWQEPPFDSIFPMGDPVPKTYHMEDFDDERWFTEKQWALIAPLLPPQPLESTRGRPSANSHAVISAIFYKIAVHESWKRLGPRFPPARTCRRYYKRWLLSGRLMTIYKVLIQDLLQRGRVHPYDFVMDDYFTLTEDRRIMSVPGVCPDTWQTRLALFLMQDTCSIFHRLRREEKDNYFPQPSIVREASRQYVKLHSKPPRRKY
jgi:transposase